jgi:hypothetical protein
MAGAIGVLTMSRPVFPSKNAELPAVTADLLTIWTPTPEDFGLDAARVAAIKSANDAAAAALTDLVAKRAAAEVATATFNDLCADVRTLGNAAVRTIDGFAIASGNPTAVWNAAGIPAPKTPSTLPPPGQPGSITASLNSLGELTLKWKCTNPRGVNGVVYQVLRGLNGAAPTPFDYTGEKTFVDATVPTGTTTVTYIIRARRGSSQGTPSSDFTVRFGVGGGGLVIAETFTSDGQNAEGKLAA